MKTFAVKEKRSAPASRRSRPSRFGYVGPQVKEQQAEIRRILHSTGAQAKLTIGQPNDKYEQEADRVAEAVMWMPEPKSVSGGASHIQQACPRCEEEELRRQQIEKEEEELQRQPIEEEEELQAKPESGHISDVNPHLESQIQSLKVGGGPLSANEGSFFEPRFGRDFSQVRMHADAQAAEAARAYTVGQDVMFGAG